MEQDMRKTAITVLSLFMALEAVVGAYSVRILMSDKLGFTFTQAVAEVIAETPSTVTYVLGFGSAPYWFQIAWWPAQLLLLFALIVLPERRSGATG